jgi:short-subunit dehydrogenase
MDAIAGRTIVITGASSGIGKALALELAARAPKLVLAARNVERLQQVASECQRRGAETLVMPADVSSRDDCRQLIERAAEQFSGIDILVNNAGLAMWCRFDELADLDVIERIMQVNYLGSVHCTHAALPYLKRSRGLIVAMASISGLLGAPLLSGYAASKHAMVGFFESLRIELKSTGVGVTIIAPDFVQSEILERAAGPDGRAIENSPLDQSKLLTAD